MCMSAIIRAVESIEGGQAELARRLGLKPQQVNQWVKDNRRVPAAHCPAIESATGIRCEQLRDDLVWTRDEAGQVTGYHVPLAGAA